MKNLMLCVLFIPFLFQSMYCQNRIPMATVEQAIQKAAKAFGTENANMEKGEVVMLLY